MHFSRLADSSSINLSIHVNEYHEPMALPRNVPIKAPMPGVIRLPMKEPIKAPVEPPITAAALEKKLATKRLM